MHQTGEDIFVWEGVGIARGDTSFREAFVGLSWIGEAGGLSCVGRGWTRKSPRTTSSRRTEFFFFRLGQNETKLKM